MQIIKLDATDSTNDYLKKMAISHSLPDYTIVTTELQQKGKGQMGSRWTSEKGKNLTFSILKRLENFDVQHQFDITCVVSLAVFRVLEELSVPDVSVKWPNDILSGNQKVCGILIENMLQGSRIQSSILGIGLNVNQTNFEGLGNATSLKLLLEKNLELDIILQGIVNQLKLHFSFSRELIRGTYVAQLFRKDQLSKFQDKRDTTFIGHIRGVSQTGLLVIESLEGDFTEYDLKEIKLVY